MILINLQADLVAKGANSELIEALDSCVAMKERMMMYYEVSVKPNEK
jgi:hypothetical protein